jgi:hypothetical protein
MQEQTLRDFFEGRTPASELARDVAGSVQQSGPASSDVAIVGMQEKFVDLPDHAVRLCDAVLGGELPAVSGKTLIIRKLRQTRFTKDETILPRLTTDPCTLFPAFNAAAAPARPEES